MSKLRMFLPALVCLLALVGVACGDAINPYAARVAGHEISIAQVEQALEEFRSTEQFQRLAQQGDVEEIERQYEQSYLAREIRRLVLEPHADEFGISVTEADVEAQLEQIRADFENETAFQEALKEQGLDEPMLRELVAERLLQDQLRAEVTRETGPDESEVRAFYDENPDQFVQVHAAHILVDDPALAQELKAQLDAAPEAERTDLFAELARENSKDPGSAEQGGDLGLQSPAGYVEPFANALAELEEGEISGPVQTEFGFHIIRLIERRAVSFEEARDQIAQQLAGPAQDEAWNRYLEAVFNEARLDLNPRYGEFDLATGQIVEPDADDVPAGEAPKEQAPPEGELPAEGV